MNYIKTAWVDNITPANTANMNKIKDELVAIEVEGVQNKMYNNEPVSLPDGGYVGATINDFILSSTTVYSSNKVESNLGVVNVTVSRYSIISIIQYKALKRQCH